MNETWFADEKVALSNNKVLREVSNATLSDRLKAIVLQAIKKNDNIIAYSEMDREKMVKHCLEEEFRNKTI
tara:strand:+ start:814 stop:1026 length:213 start_codon:yes stop_codon:yes gene_type:complete